MKITLSVGDSISIDTASMRVGQEIFIAVDDAPKPLADPRVFEDHGATAKINGETIKLHAKRATMRDWYTYTGDVPGVSEPHINTCGCCE